MNTCHWCKQPLQFVRGRGWTHLEGGVYMMRCRDCGWEGAPYPSPVKCPTCGSKKIYDLHAALPVAPEEATWGHCIECGCALTGPTEQMAQTCIPCAETMTTKRDIAALRAVIEDRHRRPRTNRGCTAVTIYEEDVRRVLGIDLEIDDEVLKRIAEGIADTFFDNGGWEIIEQVAREVMKDRLESPLLPDADLDYVMTYRPPGHGIEAHCRVRIYRRPDKAAVVIISELPDNPGMSVTNAIEYIATQIAHTYDLDPKTTVWIEHYPDRHPPGRERDRIFDETWDMVRFQQASGYSGWHLTSPHWTHLTRDKVIGLISDVLLDEYDK